MAVPKTPLLAVDIIVELGGEVVLIERKHPPHGWALPGGFVDAGEAPASAAVREAKEETSLDVELVAQLHAYGVPDRDPRGHCVSMKSMWSSSSRRMPENRSRLTKSRTLSQ